MFSGIIETQSRLISLTPKNQTTELKIERPQNWSDISVGNSISVNGICLTIQEVTADSISFILGPETLKVLESLTHFTKNNFNLERSLAIGERLHGHIVLGHVDGVGLITESRTLGDAHLLQIQLPESVLRFVWYKGSISLAGVSLTINRVTQNGIEVCLIPETLRLTNLSQYKVEDLVPFELDNFARAWVRQIEVQVESRGEL